jgi:hypothetical protein
MGDLGLEKREGVAAESVIGIGTAFDGNDTIESQRPNGRVFIIDSLHDARENVFYFGKRRLANSPGQIEDRIEGGGTVAGVGAVGAVLEQDSQRNCRLREARQQ